MKRKLKSQLDPLVPPAIGMQLSAEAIDKISQTVYSRFYQQYGMPDWNSSFNVDNKRGINNAVKQVVDAMSICDYQIYKG